MLDNKRAELNVDQNGGAWCPKVPVDTNSREYLQVDLGSVHVITATATQGRFANMKGMEYTEAYRLEYKRPGLPDFRTYISNGNETLPGNVNTYLEQKNILSPPMIASQVRFIPVAAHTRTICLRVELYGCNATGGLVSYSGVNGATRDPGFLLADDTYDGPPGPGHLLHHGLGQLYDGVLGRSLINLELQAYGRGKGWEWVGWSAEQLQGKPVQLTFTFDTMRNFTSLSLHVFAWPEDDFVPPTKAEVHFSEDGTNYHDKPLKSPSNWPPTLPAGSHNLTLDLRHRTGRVLKALFFFSGPWLAVSEVYFDSEPCLCNLTDWADGETSAPAEHTAGRRDDSHDVSAVSAVHAHTRAYMGVVIGFVVAVFLLVAAGLLVYVRRLRKKKASPHVLKSPLSDSASVAFDMKSLRLATSYSGASGGAGAAMYGPVAVPDEEGSLYHEPYKTPLFSASEYSVATIGRHFSDYSKDGAATPGHQSKSSNVVGGEYAVPILSTPPPPFNTDAAAPFATTPISAPPTPFSHATTPHSAASTPFSSSAPAPPTTLPPNGFPSLLRLCPAPPPPPVPPPPEKYLTPPVICKGAGVIGPCGMAQYRMEGMSTLKARSPREIPRQVLHFGDKLGEGDFGTVHLGEVAGLTDTKESNGPCRQVVLAALRQDASPEVREDTWREAQLLATLSDPNLAGLVGVVSRDDPLVLIMEFLPLGDLNQYLRRHVPDTTTPRLNHMRPISYGSLIYMATQVASGMKYLEAHNITHRDLATRNVLVGSSHAVKITCAGSCRSLYAGDYYTGETQLSPLPIRWMSWEALFLGHFSSRSDVWSFGVTLWEMLTLGRQQPYERLSDEGVIENLSHFYHDDGGEMFLSQPALCPREIYDLLQECWRRNEADRPNFRDIHVFLQRKNQGYSPEA
ncbi:discoidin domain-containing receptor 2 [Penaeus vannamei]|uniref:discoidin domain-containing receptor 2 n=1 Tax=Penaeus vannamei TaxID=6689 RepID=UPI00387FA52F